MPRRLPTPSAKLWLSAPLRNACFTDAIGPDEILAPIGKGGMGEVYRARDSRLNRDVAIKVSDAQFTERFTREARAIAVLNHANICHCTT